MRHFKHKILFGVLPLLAVFSLSGTSIKDVEPLKQPTPTKLNANVESSNDIYHLFYDDEAVSIELLFNSRPAAYKHFTKDTFKELADSLVEVIKEIGKQQIDLGGDLVRSLKTPTRAFDIPIPDDYTGGTRYDIDEYISAVLKTQFVYDDEIIDEQLLDYVYGNNEAYAVITTYFGYRDSIAKAGEDADEETFKQIAEEYSQALINALGGEDRIEEVVDVPSTSQAENVTEYIADQIFDLYFKEKLVESEEEYQLTAEDLSKVIDVATSAVNSSETDIVDGKNTVATLNQGNDDAVKDDVTNILEDPNLTSGQMVEIITSGDPKTINEIVIAAGVTGETFKDGLNVMTGADIAEVTEALGGAQGLKDLTQGISGLNREDLAELVIGKVKLADIIAMTKNIFINGHEIMNDKHVSFKEIQKVLRDLPKFHKIRNFSDDEMRETFAIQLDTNVGTLTFDLTLGLFGNCDYIRKIASFLDDTFDFSHLPDGTYEIKVRSPENLYKAYYRFLESDYFVGEDGDAFKHEIIDIVFSSFDEIREYVRNKDIDTLAAELKTIDYATIAETVLSAEEWNDIFGNYYHLTDAKVDRAINGFFKLIDKASTLTFDKVASFVEEYIDISSFTTQQIEDAVNKIFEYCGKVANRNFNADVFRALADKDDPSYTNDNIYAEIDKVLGDSGRRGYDKLHRILLKLLDRVSDKHADKHLMDYYQGDSHFVYNENITINFKSLLESAKKYIPDSIYPNIEEFIDAFPTTFHIDADVHIPHVHSITYVLAEHGSGEEAPTKVLALPLGAHVAFPVNQTEINGKAIAKWVDANGNEVDTMPDEDIVVYAYVDYEISIQDNTPDIYSGEGSLEVALDPEVEATYQWYKSTGAGDEELDGETNPSISLVNVEDNGSYYCVASFLNGRELTSEIVTVDIQPADINISDITWGTDVFTYDGQDHEFKLENIPQNVAVRYTLDGTELDPGVVPTGKDVKDGGYVVIPALSSTDSNYKIPDDNPFSGVEHVFTINAEEITLGEVSWLHGEGTSSDPVELSYGVAYNLAAEVEGGLPDGVILTYKLNDGAETSEAPSITALGDYHVTAIFRTDENHVFVGGETEYTFDSYYTVEVHEIDLSNLDWVDNFEYDTTAHEFVLDLSSLEDYEIDALDIVYTYGGDEYAYPEVPTGVNPGDNYVVSVAISVKPSEASNYIIKDGSFVVDTTHTFVIDRGTVHQADFVWTDEIDLDYVDSSTAYGIALVDEGVATVVYGGSTHERGKHEMTATVSVDTAFYRLLDLEGNEILSGTFDMDPQEYYVRETIDPQFTFDDVEVIYDEAIHSIILVGDNLEYFNVVYTYDGDPAAGQTNVKYENDQVAGYAVNATISLIDEDSYKLVNGAVLSYDATLTINPLEINVSDLHWDENLDFNPTYTGDNIRGNYVLTGDIPEHIKLDGLYVYSADEFINAGTYTVTAYLVAESENYIVVNDNVSEVEKTIIIEPIKIDVSPLQWYDGISFTQTYNNSNWKDYYDAGIVGKENIQVGADYVVISCAYEKGSTEVKDLTNAGSYTVTVSVTSSDANGNYAIDEATIDFVTVQDITIKPAVVYIDNVVWPDNGDNHVVYNPDPQFAGYTISVTGIEAEDLANMTIEYNGSAEAPVVNDAGTYEVAIILQVIDPDNYVFSGNQGTVVQHNTTFYVDQLGIDIKDIAFSKEIFTYIEGDVKQDFGLLNLDTIAEYSDVVKVVYIEDGKVVDEPYGIHHDYYTVEAHLTVENDNYVFVNNGVFVGMAKDYHKLFLIKQLEIDVSSVAYNPITSYDYIPDGYSFELVGLDQVQYKEDIVITYAVEYTKFDGSSSSSSTDPHGVNAGTYVVTAHLSTDNDHKIKYGTNHIDGQPGATYKINRVGVDISAVDWKNPAVLQFEEGHAYEFTLKGLPDGASDYSGITYQVSDSTQPEAKPVRINAGTYGVTATLALDSDNYYFILKNNEVASTLTYVFEREFVIKPIVYDLSTLKWNYSNDNLRYYNFEKQSVELVNVPYVLDVTYTGNMGTNIGSYTASADVKLKDYYIKTNYNIINSVADLAWSIDGKTNTTIFNDENGYISVVSDTLIQNVDLITVVVNPIETKIDVTELDLDEWFLRKDVELVSSYEMKFVNEKGETVDMKSLYGATFTVTYNIPKDSQDAELVHMFTYGDMKHVAGREEGKNTIVFTTDVLGKYTVVKSVIPPVQPADEGINIAALIFVTGGSTLTISAFYIIITFFKKKTF